MTPGWRLVDGCEPGGAARAWRDLIVVDKVAGMVEFFDAATFAPRAALKMPPLPHEVVLSPDRTRAYVSIYGLGIFGRNTEHPGHEVVAIDVARREIVGVIDTAPHRGPHGMAFDGAGTLWVSCDVSGVVIAIDVARRAVLAAVPTDSHGTHWLVATPDGAKVYASNKTYPFAVVIDARERRLRAKIPLPHGSEGLAVSPDGARLYVMSQRPHALHVIDTATDAPIATVPIAGFAPTPEGKNPQKRVQVSPDGRYVLVTSFATGEIAIAPIERLGDQTLVAVEKGPMGIAFADARHAFVMNHDAGTVSLVDVIDAKIVDRFATQPGPETMALVRAA
jgi:YVTN family beta-propeller protein